MCGGNLNDFQKNMNWSSSTLLYVLLNGHEMVVGILVEKIMQTSGYIVSSVLI